MMKFLKNEDGATAIEYGLIVTLIAVGILATVTAVGNDISGLFSGTDSEISEVFDQ